MLYEFIVGIPPFNDDTVDLIFDNILNLRITWPEISDDPNDEDCMSSAAQDLILKLLTLDPAKRLKVDEIKKHRFFENINWETLRRQPAKIIPEYKSTLDTTAFEREGKQFEKDEKLNPFGDQNPNDDDDADDSDGEDGPAVTRMDSTKFRNFNLVRLDLLHE
mmetsp:Transcript_16530/g.14304  ORF Transcript_16530/g.14304 Transcript_16530/m.14304 type:complete len:163 (-) Transcript_16530:1216-1704(-)